jgi:hypothetical protein
MPQFNSIKQLEAYINKLAKETLQNDDTVKNAVVDVMQQHVQTDVYDAYPNPKVYVRTGLLGSEESFQRENTGEGIAIYNTRQDGDVYIPEVIETGEGYSFRGYGYDYEKPRPFIENSRQDLRKNGQHVDALKKALKSKGLSIE